MKKARSPGRSMEVETTPKVITQRRSRSAGSARSSSAIINHNARQSNSSFDLSFRSPKSFLSDKTCITAPNRKSWWKKLGEDTVQNIVSQDNPARGMDDILNDYERDEPLSQEHKNYDLGLPDISENETIENIEIAQKRLFHPKANPLRTKFTNVIEKDDSTCNQDITIPKASKTQASAFPTITQKSKPIFPAALLNMSSTSTSNKTQELPNLEHKVRPKNLFANIVTMKKNAFTNLKLVESEDESLGLERQVKTKKLFGNHMTNKRNTRFSGIVAMESDEDIPNIQPKVFTFQKPGKRHRSSVIQGEALSSSLSMSDIEFNNWNMLPSSTMVEDNFSGKSTPAKKSRFTRESNEKNSIENKEIEQQIKHAPEFSKTPIEHIGVINAENRDNNKKINKSTTHLSFMRNTQINTSITSHTLKRSEQNNQSDENNDVNVNSIDKPTLETEQQYQGTEMAYNQNFGSESETGPQIQILDNAVRKEYNGVENESVPSSVQENNIHGVKIDEIDLTKQNDPIGNHVVDHRIIENQNVITNEENPENPNIHTNSLNNNEQMRELQQKNIYIEIMEDNFRPSNTKANDNLNKLRQNNTHLSENDVNDTQERVECETETEENANFIKNQISKIASQEVIEEKLDSENEGMSEIKSVLQDEQSEEESEKEGDIEVTFTEKESSKKEAFKTEKKSENKSQNLTNKEASLYINTDGSKDINCDEDNNEAALTKDNTMEVDIKNTHSEDCEESRSIAESNHNVVVEQTPENTTEISNTDKTSESEASKIRSPEAVLNHSQKTFIRNSVRTTNFIERVTLRPSFFSVRDSLDLPNHVSKNSTEEGSGWDSHRTTRKTLRQTFGKDFTFRKSLRTLVIEKSAKRYTNGDNLLVDEIIPDITKSPDLVAHSKVYDQQKSFMPNTPLGQKSSEIVKLALENSPIQSNETGHQENIFLEKSNIQDDLAKSNRSKVNVIEIINKSIQKYDLGGEKETNCENKATKISKSALEGELANESDVREEKNDEIESANNDKSESSKANENVLNESGNKNESKIHECVDINENDKIESDINESAEENKSDLNISVEPDDIINKSTEENDDDVIESDEKNGSDINESTNESDMNESTKENDSDINESVEANESDINISVEADRDNLNESAGENEDNVDESAELNESNMNKSTEENESGMNESSEENESDETNENNTNETAGENEDDVNEYSEINELSNQNYSTVNRIIKKNGSVHGNYTKNEIDGGDSSDEKSIEENDSDDENNSSRLNETTENKTAFEESEENDEMNLGDSANEHQITDDDELTDNNEEENNSAGANLQQNEYKLNATDESTKMQQAQLDAQMQKIMKENEERIKRIREKVMNDLKAPVQISINYNWYKSKQLKQALPKPVKAANRKPSPFGPPPKEFLEDMKYKPPKQFKARNAPWINKRLYKFLESKLEPTYDYRAHYRAEKLAIYIYKFTQEFKKDRVYPIEAINQLKQEMARLKIVNTHFEFDNFCREFMPKEIRTKIIPDIINRLPLPRAGIFSEILINRQ